LKYEVGASPVEVMAEMGHTSPSLALSIYTKKLKVSRDTGARMDALVRPTWTADVATSELEREREVSVDV
jgi:hypothetical protein